MGIDKLTEITLDDVGGGCALIFTPSGTEKGIGFQEIIPVDSKLDPKLVMLITEEETGKGSQRLPRLAEVVDGLVAFRLARHFQSTVENYVVTFPLDTAG